jgi:hypothetical protein
MEAELYENIVEIPHYDSKWLQMLDREDEEELVRSNFKEFQTLYRPIIEQHFNDVMEIDRGIVTIDESESARIKMMGYLNDNIFQNIDEKFRV